MCLMILGMYQLPGFMSWFEFNNQVPTVWFYQEPDMCICLLVKFDVGHHNWGTFRGVHKHPEVFFRDIGLSFFAPSMPVLAIEFEIDLRMVFLEDMIMLGDILWNMHGMA
jgi:hypothetical protein